MKKKLVAVCTLVGFSISPSIASDSYDYCTAFAKANELDPEPCACIAGNVGDDADLLAEQAALETLDDVEAASSELREAINACVSS